MKIKINEKHLFIFDLDGTLVNAYRAVHKSLNYTRTRFGLSEVSYYDAKIKLGRGQNRFIDTFFPGMDKEVVLNTYRSHHRKALIEYARLRSNAKQLLRMLKLRGKTVAIASNRPFNFTKFIAEYLGIKKYIDYILCADQVGHLKPDPTILYMILKKLKIKKEQALYIGDMLIDYQTARSAGLDFIFIRGGSSESKQAKRIKCIKKVNNLIEVISINKS
ncbi:MAG: HAD family hydrolase [Candidatus Gygaella obscura]|nr:HAD family hydrolase [Candidatus Gygaella obscura]